MSKIKGSRNGTSYLLDIAKTMPPLYHKLPNEDYDVNKSEVAKWLVNQPDIMNYIVNRIKSCKNFIVYDPSTGKWHGVDYDN